MPFALAACLLPGKFQSTLTIHADRSFTFIYKGEVIAQEQAPGFAGEDAEGGESNARLGGVFTLVTDAEIVSQNSGSATTGGPGKTLRWEVSPATAEAPMAELKMTRR